jgi:GNAT superfamily N-acetyltransferase
MEPSVRRITPDDAALLADLRLRALADAPYAFSTTYDEAAARPPDSWTEQARDHADGHGGVTFFAEVDGEAVGMVGGCFADDPSVANLVAMWVAPDGRRSGSARALVAAVTEWARAGGAKEVQLWVVDGNEAARRLYESAGFGEVPPDPESDELPQSETRMSRRL